MSYTRRLFLKLAAIFGASRGVTVVGAEEASRDAAHPFGDEFPQLDSLTVGQWWKKPRPKGANAPPPLDVPRDEVVAFAIYTHDHGVLKLTAQLYPLRPDEPREARLELERKGEWVEVATSPVLVPGWSAHFRLEEWDATHDVPYAVFDTESSVLLPFNGRQGA